MIPCVPGGVLTVNCTDQVPSPPVPTFGPWSTVAFSANKTRCALNARTTTLPSKRLRPQPLTMNVAGSTAPGSGLSMRMADVTGVGGIGEGGGIGVGMGAGGQGAGG